MTAVATPPKAGGATLAGALLSEPVDWKGINWKKVNRNVKQLQVRIVKAIGQLILLLRPVKGRYELLEPCAVKVASTVLRGGGSGNAASLPDRWHESN